MKTTPYTYLIGWSDINKYYYGARYAKGCHPSDLWFSYFTSSKFVAEIISTHGKPDIIQVRKTFSSGQEALRWEQKVLRRVNVVSNKKWINCGVGGSWYIEKQTLDHITKRTKNKQHHPRQREIALAALEKAVKANTGKRQSKETQDKKRATYRRNLENGLISPDRPPRSSYIINGQIYNGNKAVMDAFNITEPTIYNRVNNPKFNWSRINE